MLWGSWYDLFQNRKIDRLDQEARAAKRSMDDRLAELSRRIDELEVRSGVFEVMLRERFGVSIEELDAAVAKLQSDKIPTVGTCESCGRTVPSRDGSCFYCGGKLRPLATE